MDDPPSVSQAVSVDDDETFHNTTFALKRTRSLGVLDEFQRPKEPAQTKEDFPHLEVADESEMGTSVGSSLSGMNNDHDVASPTTLSSGEDYFSHRSPANSQYYEHGDDDYDHSVSLSPSIPESPDVPQPIDDIAVKPEPSKRVDYFTHNWNESDISASWRYIVLRRKDVANSARLENASWRSWTKAKYNLKTVAPETVNWLKDSDVTWLYGPLYEPPRASESRGRKLSSNSPRSGPSSSADKDRSKPSPPVTKPILKKKSASQMMLSGPGLSSYYTQGPHHSHHPPQVVSPGSTNLHHQENAPTGDVHQGPATAEALLDDNCDSATDIYLRHHNYRTRPRMGGHSNEDLSRYVNRQYRHVPGHLAKPPPGSPGPLSPEEAASASSSSLSLSTRGAGRHIHFNDRVEQCRAVDITESESEDDDDDDDEDEDDNNNRHRESAISDESEASDSEDDSEDEAGLFLMVRSSSSASLHKKNTLGPLSSNQGKESPHTIELLPATTLKYDYDDSEREARQRDQAHSVAYAMSHNTVNRRHVYKTYDYSSVYQSPTETPHSSPKDSSTESLPDMRFSRRDGINNNENVPSPPQPQPQPQQQPPQEKQKQDTEYHSEARGNYDNVTPTQVVLDRGDTSTPPPMSPSAGTHSTHTTTEYAVGQIGPVSKQQSCASSLLMDQRGGSEFVEFAEDAGSPSSKDTTSNADTQGWDAKEGSSGIGRSVSLPSVLGRSASDPGRNHSSSQLNQQQHHQERDGHSRFNAMSAAKGLASVFKGGWKRS